MGAISFHLLLSLGLWQKASVLLEGVTHLGQRKFLQPTIGSSQRAFWVMHRDYLIPFSIWLVSHLNQADQSLFSHVPLYHPTTLKRGDYHFMPNDWLGDECFKV